MKKLQSSRALCLVSVSLISTVVACGGTVDLPTEGVPDVSEDTTTETSPADTATSSDSGSPDTTIEDGTTPPDTTPGDSDPDTSGCVVPKKVCGGTCVDPSSDNANCGDCGIACTSGTTCTSGICACSSPKITCGTACVDVSSDPTNCGACGKACPTGAPCTSGVCGTCPVAKPTLCGTACTDTATDPLHCGSCTKVCPLGATCTAGVCACPAGQIICGTACVDVSTDATNCGGCGKVCPTSATCTSGICTCPTAKPTTCGSLCSDMTSDVLNCGACFKACPKGATCTASACVCPTTTPDVCLGACVNKLTDPNNCGTCGNYCGGGTCSGGVCSCTGTLTKCGTTCVDTSSDPLNCGACGTKCTGLCVASVCATPKCKTLAPNVLFYGPSGSSEKAYLPTGAVTTVATAATWLTMTTADFAKYDIIVFGEPDGGGPTYAGLQTAYDTRVKWGAAINGRVVVTGLDPAFHAPSRTGAATWLRATMSWLATGPTGSTALFVSSDWGRRNLDFLQPLGLFTSTGVASDTVTITLTTHPIMTGSTSASLSSWSQSAHSSLTIPTSFTSIATTVGGATVVAPRDVACTP